MITGENDPGALQQSLFSQRLHELPHFVVDLLHRSSIVCTDLALVVGGKVGVVHTVPGASIASDALFADTTHILVYRRDSLRHSQFVHLVQKLLIWIVGAVRPRETHHCSERRLLAVGSDEVGGFVAHKVIDREFPGQAVDDGATVFVVAFVFVAVILPFTLAAEEAIVVVAHVDPAFVLGNHAHAKAQRGIPWVKVHLAHGGGVVSPSGEQFGPGAHTALGQIGAQPLSIAGDTCFDGVHARQQRCPRRDTDGRDRVGAIIAHPLRGEGVNVWRLYKACTITAQKV